MRIVILLSVILPLCVTASVIENAKTAAEFVEEELLTDGYEGKIIYSYPAMFEEGDLLSTWHQDVRVPFNSYLIFIDDMALANWEHPCRWVFVSPTGEMEIIELYTPPNDMHLMNVEFRGIPQFDQKQEPDPRQWLIDWFEPNPQPNPNPENCYAWLISGGMNSECNHTRYYGDIQFIYMTLTQDYGYTNDKIVICFADGLDLKPDQSTGLNSNPDLDGDLTDDFDYDATFSGIMNGYNDIAAMIGQGDHLFIMTTDHGSFGKGGKLSPEGVLNLWNNEYLDDDIFKAMLDTLDCETIHVTMEQCFSGTFLEEVICNTGAPNRTFASAANADETSHGGATMPYFNEWIYWWTGAMHGSVPPILTASGELFSDPDLNQNGYINFSEASDFAELWDSTVEHPQYAANPIRCGSWYYLGGEIPRGTVREIAATSTVPIQHTLNALPNPASSTISIAFDLTSSCSVDLTVYDIAGRCVTTLVSEPMGPGSYSFSWEAASEPAGTYLVKLCTDDQVQTVKVVRTL